jgi:hypothetical protein
VRDIERGGEVCVRDIEIYRESEIRKKQRQRQRQRYD